MIRNVLAPVLQKKFANKGVILHSDSNVMATFPASHPDVGDVTVWDDENEVTVGIREITHTHFETTEGSMSPSVMAQQVTADVVHFLENLFADRILLWRSWSGRSASWQLVEGSIDDVPREKTGRWFVWSGPLP